MKLSFFGAAGEVTGSCYLLETGRARVLIDFGLHQGEHEERNRTAPPIGAGALDAVILTHAHLDHAGLMPLIPGLGYRGKVWATPATIDLVAILLADSAKLQSADAERAERYRAQGRGYNHHAGDPPLYGQGEVDEFLGLLAPLPYGEAREVAPGVVARLVDAGHIIGSASVELTVETAGGRKVIAFSGDIGPRGAPLVRDPTPLTGADVVLLESTYGDRDHRSREETVRELGEITKAARGSEGKVLIPAFAVGRTQDLIYEFGKMSRAGGLRSRVFVDSPMAVKATELYERHCKLLDAETWEIVSKGGNPLGFSGLEFTATVEDSKRLNRLDGGTVVIAGSGMCTGGRIVHHLRYNLPNPATQVVFVGFQAVGTLGRRLVDGQKIVRIMGEEVPVKAQVHTLGGLSAHSGQSGLVAWAGNFKNRPRVFLTHGENGARQALGARLKRELGWETGMPGFGEVVEV